MGTQTLCLSAGGAKRDRTADLLHAMQALSQLSYSPETEAHSRVVLLGCQALDLNNL